MTVVRLLRDDPVLREVRGVQEDVARLVQGYFRDGLSALEDALATSDEADREELVRTAREYFRQAVSREAGAASTRAGEYVALCYDVLDEPQQAKRWLETTYRRCGELHRDAILTFNASKTFGEGLKDDFAPAELRSWLSALVFRKGRIRPVPDDAQGRAFEQCLLLEQHARRLCEQLPARGIDCTPLPAMFREDDAETLLVWDKSSGGMVYGTRDRSGNVRQWTLPRESIPRIAEIVGVPATTTPD